MRAASTSQIDAGASIAEMESETDSTSTVKNFDALITGDELNGAVQLPNFRSVVMMLYVAQG